MLIFNVTTTMLTEFVPNRSSTGVALNNILRNTLACIACIIAEPLITAIGTGWLFTGMSTVCWCSSVVLILMKRNGERWSEDMARKLSSSGL
jgi:Mn2+/Fe2+ NRAMP family transporter